VRLALGEYSHEYIRACYFLSCREKIGIGRLSLLFHDALQGVLVLACVIHHLRHLGLRDLVAKDAALADTVIVHLKHDLHRFLSVLVEEGLQNGDHELHGGVVVVEQKNATHIRALLRALRPAWGGNPRRNSADENGLRHPASITKVMTLYVLFEPAHRGDPRR